MRACRGSCAQKERAERTHKDDLRVRTLSAALSLTVGDEIQIWSARTESARLAATASPHYADYISLVQPTTTSQTRMRCREGRLHERTVRSRDLRRHQKHVGAGTDAAVVSWTSCVFPEAAYAERNVSMESTPTGAGIKISHACILAKMSRNLMQFSRTCQNPQRLADMCEKTACCTVARCARRSSRSSVS